MNKKITILRIIQAISMLYFGVFSIISSIITIDSNIKFWLIRVLMILTSVSIIFGFSIYPLLLKSNNNEKQKSQLSILKNLKYFHWTQIIILLYLLILLLKNKL